MPKFPYKSEIFTHDEASLVKFSPGNWSMQGTYLNHAEKIYNMEVRPDDIWIISHPKTGTTWSCELVWTVANNADVKTANTVPQFTRICFPDFDHITELLLNDWKKKGKPIPEATTKEFSRSLFDECVNHPSPRIIKSHCPLALLPPNLVDKCKVIYCGRNPLDTVVSFHHFVEDINVSKQSLEFDMFFDIFMAEILPYGPYCDHMKEAWELRNHPNMLFICYEDMKRNLGGVIRQVANFLHKPINPEQMKDLLQYLDMKGMKNNKMVNMDIYREHGLYKQSLNFMRKGVVGDFKNHFTPEMEQKMKEWWHERMGKTGLIFPGVDLNPFKSKLS